MRTHHVLSWHTVRRFLLWLLMAILAYILLLAAAQTVAARCVANPTGETAVGLRHGASRVRGNSQPKFAERRRTRCQAQDEMT